MKRVFAKLVDLLAFDEAAYECIGSFSKGLHARIDKLFRYFKCMTSETSLKVSGIPAEVVDAVISSPETESLIREKEENELVASYVRWLIKALFFTLSSRSIPQKMEKRRARN